ncbi:MAG: DUF1553 domain-containing protein [Planctomycetales bacterium]|nr:DUF1553 domain-containing protein [Planctomycetales bacterium]
MSRLLIGHCRSPFVVPPVGGKLARAGFRLKAGLRTSFTKSIAVQLKVIDQLVLVITITLMSMDARANETTQDIDFSRDIRPILSDKCFRCHGPDEEERASDLRLDVQSIATAKLESGVTAIIASDTEASELIRRIDHADADVRMPPIDSGKSLSDNERKLLRDWIRQGAPWAEHWAFVAPRRPALPTAGGTWARNSIDRFTARKQSAAGLAPKEEATREQLIRRVTFDLTGLPPTPEEVERFAGDCGPDAYERLVDRLLESPRYGEHMARHWLDAARYGDTHGLHLDNERSIWPFRDWVIRAYNSNMPFDQFTIEQLAGDLLPNPTLDQLVATGFNRCNVTTGEGGSIDEEYYVRYAVDRVETTSTVWLGLTTGCAVCHDHKFDPISQNEFYGLFSFFFSLTEKAMDGNALLPPPSIKSPTDSQLRQLAAIEREIESAQAAIDGRKQSKLPEFNAWDKSAREQNVQNHPPQDHILLADFESIQGDELTFSGDIKGKVIGKSSSDAGKFGSAFRFDGQTTIEVGETAAFESGDAFSYGAWIYCIENGAMTVVSKMDGGSSVRGYDLYVGGGKLFAHLIHDWEQGNAIRVNTKQPIPREKWQHVMVTYDGSGKAAGVRIFVDGDEQELKRTHDNLSGTIKSSHPLRIGRRTDSAPFTGLIDDVRIYGRELSSAEVGLLAGIDPIKELLALDPQDRTQQQTATLLEHFLTTRDPEFARLRAELSKVRNKKTQLESEYSSTLIMRESEVPRQAHVLVRGQYDQKGAPVQPDVPKVLPPLSRANERPNRLDLAKWLVDPAHPLTARVTVNRIWQQHFGTGLVKTTGDFGSQGEWPSHPDLLDWLATEFIESGWNVKALHRLIVTSATYRQSSFATVAEYNADPENRFLARGPRHRLDAEQVRDNALLISGLLNEQIGGKSVKPYQPEGLWFAVGYTSSNTARFKRDTGPALYRRGLYTFWKRTSPPPMMQIFDAPSREYCTVNRPRTNTPAAALAMMNGEQFVEIARHFAERIMLAEESDEQRIEFAYRWATSRSATANELSVVKAMLSDFRDHYKNDSEAAKELLSVGESQRDKSLDGVEHAAWTMIASTLLNLDETISKQ